MGKAQGLESVPLVGARACSALAHLQQGNECYTWAEQARAPTVYVRQSGLTSRRVSAIHHAIQVDCARQRNNPGRPESARSSRDCQRSIASALLRAPSLK